MLVPAINPISIKHLNSTVNSTDADLRLLIARIQEDTPIVSDVHTFDQAIQYTSNTLAVEVGEALLTQRVLLLPTIYETFCDNVMEITNSTQTPGTLADTDPN